MSLANCFHCLQSRNCPGATSTLKDSIAEITKWCWLGRMNTKLLEKNLGSFLQSASLTEYSVKTQRNRKNYPKLRLGLCRMRRYVAALSRSGKKLMNGCWP